MVSQIGETKVKHFGITFKLLDFFLQFRDQSGLQCLAIPRMEEGWVTSLIDAM